MKLTSKVSLFDLLERLILSSIFFYRFFPNSSRIGRGSVIFATEEANAESFERINFDFLLWKVFTAWVLIDFSNRWIYISTYMINGWALSEFEELDLRKMFIDQGQGWWYK